MAQIKPHLKTYSVSKPKNIIQSMKMQMQIHAEIGPTFGRQALHSVLAMMNNDFDLTLGLEHLN